MKLLQKYTNAEKENAMTCKAAIWYLSEYCLFEKERKYSSACSHRWEHHMNFKQTLCKRVVKNDV